MDGMRLSALRFPLIAGSESFFDGVVVVSKARARGRVARTVFRFVIAGLDPAIHGDRWLAQIRRIVLICRTSAWTTGSSPVVTREEGSSE
jgi:hypothetical protein